MEHLLLRRRPPFHQEMFKPHCFNQRQISKRTDTEKKEDIQQARGRSHGWKKAEKKEANEYKASYIQYSAHSHAFVPLSCKCKLKWHLWRVGERRILLLLLPDFLFLLSLHAKVLQENTFKTLGINQSGRLSLSTAAGLERKETMLHHSACLFLFSSDVVDEASWALNSCWWSGSQNCYFFLNFGVFSSFFVRFRAESSQESSVNRLLSLSNSQMCKGYSVK